MPRLLVFSCLQNICILWPLIKRGKWLIQLISGKTDVKIRCLCMFSELIFSARGLKPAILLYYLCDNLPCFMRCFLLPDLYFIDRQINVTLNFPVHLLCPSWQLFRIAFPHPVCLPSNLFISMLVMQHCSAASRTRTWNAHPVHGGVTKNSRLRRNLILICFRPEDKRKGFYPEAKFTIKEN